MFFFSESHAFQCYVVSDFENFKGDIKKFAENHMPLLHQDTSVVNGRKCYIINDWSLLEEKVKKTSSKSESIMIYQGSHGGPGGVVYINKKTVPGEEVYKVISKLSLDRKVFAAIESCHSGDILKIKLKNDSVYDPKTKNLCLFTSSNFLEESYGMIKNEHNINKTLAGNIEGLNAEEVIQSLNFGLISSAPWDSLMQYLEKQTLENAIKAFTTIDQANRSLVCTDHNIQGALLYADSEITDEDLKILTKRSSKNLRERS